MIFFKSHTLRLHFSCLLFFHLRLFLIAAAWFGEIWRDGVEWDGGLSGMEENKKSGGGDVRAKALAWDDEWDKAWKRVFSFSPLAPTVARCARHSHPSPPEEKAASRKKSRLRRKKNCAWRKKWCIVIVCVGGRGCVLNERAVVDSFRFFTGWGGFGEMLIFWVCFPHFRFPKSPSHVALVGILTF